MADIKAMSTPSVFSRCCPIRGQQLIINYSLFPPLLTLWTGQYISLISIQIGTAIITYVPIERYCTSTPSINCHNYLITGTSTYMVHIMYDDDDRRSKGNGQDRPFQMERAPATRARDF